MKTALFTSLTHLITLTLCLIFYFTFLSAYFFMQEVTIQTLLTCGQAKIQLPAALTILVLLTIFFFSQPIEKCPVGYTHPHLRFPACPSTERLMNPITMTLFTSESPKVEDASTSHQWISLTTTSRENRSSSQVANRRLDNSYLQSSPPNIQDAIS